MPLIHKKAQARNLQTRKTWVRDTDPASRYFRVTQIPDVFTAGKNAFLINGSDELIKNTEVLIELTDINGNVVFSTPVANYQEGLARVVSVEVYSDTPAGLGTLTILGEIRQTDDGTIAPPEWRGVYNVVWQTRVTISPTAVNSTPIRLYKSPTLEISEILTPYNMANRVGKTVTSPVGVGISGIPSSRVFEGTLSFKTDYTIISEEPLFTREMIGGEVLYNVSGTLYSSSIDDVINSTMAQINPGYTVNGYLEQFDASEIMIEYSGSEAMQPTKNIKSYAEVKLNQLATFSGNVYRAKIFSAPGDSTADYHLAGDVEIKPSDILSVSTINAGEERVKTGDIKDQGILNAYWVFGKIGDPSYSG